MKIIEFDEIYNSSVHNFFLDEITSLIWSQEWNPLQLVNFVLKKKQTDPSIPVSLIILHGA